MFIPVPYILKYTYPNMCFNCEKEFCFCFSFNNCNSIWVFLFCTVYEDFPIISFRFLSVAPQPPQRDPQTSLSVGKAQGKQYAEGMAELGMYIYTGI